MPYGSYILDLRLILVAEKAFCLTLSHVFSDLFDVKSCGLAKYIEPGGHGICSCRITFMDLQNCSFY